MSVSRVVHSQLDKLSRKLAMTKAGHVLYLEYTYDATGSVLSVCDEPLLAEYLPLVSSAFVQYRLCAKVSLYWVNPAILYYHREYPLCKAISVTPIHQEAMAVDHNGYPYFLFLWQSNERIVYDSRIINSLLGGAEYGEKIVKNMNDLYSLGKQDKCFGNFVENLRQAIKRVYQK